MIQNTNKPARYHRFAKLRLSYNVYMHLHSASEDAVCTIKLYLDYFEKPSGDQGPAFNYIENVKKLNLKKF